METNLSCSQKRCSSIIWWVGLAACIFQAVTQAIGAMRISMPWWVNVIGVALAAVLMYCNGNNPTNPNGY